MKHVVKLFNSITIIFTIGILLLASMLVVPRAFNLNPYIVKSGSMEPIIKTGSIAFINEKETDVNVGDIVTYKLENDDLITHRIDSIDENGDYITKGDANEVTDAKSVTKAQIVGKYKYSIPFVGYLMEKKEKVIPLTLLWIFGLNLASIMLSRVYEEKEEENKDIKEGTTENSNIEDINTKDNNIEINNILENINNTKEI